MITVRRITTTIVAASMLFIAAPAAHAETYGVTATPTTSLQSGAKVTVTVTGLTGTLGVYTSVCKKGASAQDTPTPCDAASQTWITATGDQGSAKNSATFTANSSFNGVNCLVDACVIYVRGDHNNAKDYSLIRTVALGFVGGGAAKIKDTAVARFGLAEAKPNVPDTLYYRQPVDLFVNSISGLKVTLKSMTADCTVDGNTITALSGTGSCAIAATTEGNDTYAPLNVNFPYYLKPAVQHITAYWPTGKLKLGATAQIDTADLTSSLAQKVSLVSKSKSCTVSVNKDGWSVKATKVGACQLVASASAQADKWTAATVRANIVVKK